MKEVIKPKSEIYEQIKKKILDNLAGYIVVAAISAFSTVVIGSILFTLRYSGELLEVQADITKLVKWKEELDSDFNKFMNEDALKKQEIQNRLSNLEKVSDKIDNKIDQLLLK